ncbi:MAG: hypothetical protein IJ760_00790 [Bacteroidales bacterium]|nr:hypothetical protein [Bacteroidales bacterium]
MMIRAPYAKPGRAHDFAAPCVYYLTVRTHGWQPLLGRIEGSTGDAWVVPSAYGQIAAEELAALPRRFGELMLVAHTVMPDHVHFILNVHSRLACPSGLPGVIASWKAACMERVGDGRPLFADGFEARVMVDEGQYMRVSRYMHDNPRRTLMAAAACGLFDVRRGVEYGSYRFDAVGNAELLRGSLVAVHVRRHWSERQWVDYGNRCLRAAGEGCVLVGAFVSEVEQSIGIKAVEHGASVVRLLPHPMDDHYKPAVNAFYTCAEGRLLHLSPWPAMGTPPPAGRDRFNSLNVIAEGMALHSRILSNG